jgi:hypothetical protein
MTAHETIETPDWVIALTRMRLVNGYLHAAPTANSRLGYPVESREAARKKTER